MGHHARECVLLKQMNRTCRRTPLMRYYWGELKAEHIAEEVKSKLGQGQKRRKIKEHEKRMKRLKTS